MPKEVMVRVDIHGVCLELGTKGTLPKCHRQHAESQHMDGGVLADGIRQAECGH